MKHIICATVENRSGVLARISGLFAARGYNIDSLCVAETEDPDISRMTVVTHGNDAVIEQIRKQLEKVIDTVKVTDISATEHIERDLLLLRVNTPQGRRGEILEIGEVFKAKVVDIGAKHVSFEVTGPEAKVNAFIEMMRPFGIREAARTGRIAMVRG